MEKKYEIGGFFFISIPPTAYYFHRKRFVSKHNSSVNERKDSQGNVKGLRKTAKAFKYNFSSHLIFFVPSPCPLWGSVKKVPTDFSAIRFCASIVLQCDYIIYFESSVPFSLHQRLEKLLFTACDNCNKIDVE